MPCGRPRRSGTERPARSARARTSARSKDRLHRVQERESLLDRIRGMDPHGVPLHEATLEGEVPDGIDVLCFDHGEDDVVRAEDAQRDDVDTELLGELRGSGRRPLSESAASEHWSSGRGRAGARR